MTMTCKQDMQDSILGVVCKLGSVYANLQHVSLTIIVNY